MSTCDARTSGKLCGTPASVQTTEGYRCTDHQNLKRVSGANDKQVGGTYYQKPIQPWDYITANGIGFLEGNAIKYISRHREKNKKEDLEKAIHYLQKAIEVYYP